MLDWISDTLMAIMTYIPALVVDQNSPNFELVRAMFGLILIVFVVFVIAMTPFRDWIRNFGRRLSSALRRKS